MRSTPDVIDAVVALLKVLDSDPADFKPSTITVPAATPANPKYPRSEIRFLRLQHLSIEQAADSLAARRPWEGILFIKMPSHQALLASGNPEVLQKYEEFIKELDVPATPTDAIETESTATLEFIGLGGDEVARRGGLGGQRGVQGGRGASGGVGVQVEPQEHRVFQLEHLAPDEALATLRPLFGYQASFGSTPNKRVVIVISTDKLLKSIEAVISALDIEPVAATESSTEGEATLDRMVTYPMLGGATFMPGNTGHRLRLIASPRSVIRVFPLQHMDPAAAATAISPLFQKLRQVGGDAYIAASFVPVSSRRMLIARAEPDVLKKIEVLLLALDVPDEATSSADATPPVSAETVAAKPGELTVTPGPDGRPIYGIKTQRTPVDPAYIDQLQAEYAQRDATVRERVAQFRQSGDGAKAEFIRQSLTSHVADAFDARQKLQQAELAALEDRAASMRRTLAAREKIKDEIVQRRVEELLNPALEWESTGLTPSTSAATTGEVAADANVAATEKAAAPVAAASPTRPYGSTERLYRGKTESNWKQLFASETEPVAKLEAAIALLNLAAQAPLEQLIERILELGEEVVRIKHTDEPLAFAFDGLPPNRWSISGEDQRKAFLQYHQEVDQKIALLPTRIVAEELARAITGESVPRAAYAFAVLTYSARTRILTDEPAATLMFAILSDAHLVEGGNSTILPLLSKLQVANVATEGGIAQLKQQIIETSDVLRTSSSGSQALQDSYRDWLTNYNPFPSGLLRDGDVTSALAELILDDVVRGRSIASLVKPQPILINNPSLGDMPSRMEFIRQGYGPALNSWVAVANEYLEQHRAAPYSEADRAICRGLLRATSLDSDGDDWPVARSAEILTEQLRAAYTDDLSQTIDEPVTELLPALPATMLAPIVAITGKIPEFLGTATPKSKPVATKLATLKRLLAGQVPIQHSDEELGTLNGLLGEAPVETIGRLIADSVDDPTGPAVELNTGYRRSLSDFLYSHSTLNPDVPAAWQSAQTSGAYGGAYPSKSTIDPLLLLAVLADLTGADEGQDRRIASLFELDLQNVSSNDHIALNDHIKNLLASKLQSRHHAARMLREMASRTKSRELRDRIHHVDPSIAEAPTTSSTAEPGTPPPAEAAY